LIVKPGVQYGKFQVTMSRLRDRFNKRPSVVAVTVAAIFVVLMVLHFVHFFSRLSPDFEGMGIDKGTYNSLLSFNQLPVANAGPSQTVEQDSPEGASVTLNGSASYDPNGDDLTYYWTWAVERAARDVKPTIILPPGATTVTLIVNNGTYASQPNTVYIIVKDTIAPYTAIQLSGRTENAPWYISDVKVVLSAIDKGSGVSLTEYSFDKKTWYHYNTPFEISDEGEIVVYYRSKDNTGNIEPTKSKAIYIDKTPPVTLISTSGKPGNDPWYLSDVQVTVAAIDGASGIAATGYSFDNETWYPYTTSFIIYDKGKVAVYYGSLDRAGNIEETKCEIIYIDSIPAANAGPDQIVEQDSIDGATVTLDGSASTDPDSDPGTHNDLISFDWYEGDIYIDSGETIDVVFGPGAHTIMLVVTDSAGGTDEDEVAINVQNTTFYLHDVARNLMMNNATPRSTSPKYKDSPTIHRTTFREIGTWTYTVPAGMALQLDSSRNLYVWVGLANNNDQGTYFDIYAEVLKNGNQITYGGIDNIRGVVRNANSAKEVVIPFEPIDDSGLNPGDVLSIRIFAKVTAASSHRSAVGLRLYYDAISRPSRFEPSSTP
jgi:hypothetical protein